MSCGWMIFSPLPLHSTKLKHFGQYEVKLTDSYIVLVGVL